MQQPAGINRRYASFAVFFLAVIWVWVAFDRPYIFPEHTPWNIYSGRPQTPTADVFDYPPLTSPAIRTVCDETHFNHSLIFTCENSSGNVAEIRNSILNCVRYTIAAGGSLILPKIVVAGNSDSYKFLMEYMFDTRHFFQSLEMSCPQLRVYKSLNDIPNRHRGSDPLSLSPGSIGVKDTGGHVIATEWRKSFYIWLSQYISSEYDGPIIIELERSYLQWSIDTDDPMFTAHFGKILKIRSDIRMLATTTLTRLSAALSMRLPLTETIIPGAFLGAYLSTRDGPTPSKDKERVQARFDAQLELYLGQTFGSNLSIIYLASDDTTYIPQFMAEAAVNNVSVTSKFDLMKGEDREAIQALGPEQQAVIDFLVFSKASDFAGVGYSSLAWNVALRRHQFAKQEKDWLSGEETLLTDDLSQIYGPPGGHPEFVASMWP